MELVTEPAHPIPDWLEPVLAFVNTVDVEEGTDELAAGPAALSAWLTGRGLAREGAGAAATAADHRLAMDLRAGLRALALANNGVPVTEPDLVGIRRALVKLPLVADPESAGPALSPYREAPVTAALSRLAAGYAAAQAAGVWHRLRRCPADDCAWAFWDSSAKGTRRWCTMRVCGNRAKARTFARRRGDPISAT